MVTIDKIQSAVYEVAKKWPIQECYLFGSYSRNEATEESDVDLIIDLPEGITYLDLERIQNDLYSLIGVPVDLKTMNALRDNPRFFNYIQNDLIKLFSIEDWRHVI